jgi:predicted glycosyltransferase involved in capsule biosynthesis
MPKLTVLYTYFGQKEMIPRILDEKQLGVRVVIIDDCSPIPLGKIRGADVYRIDDDIKWNQGGAKNLGFHVSAGWVLYSDIDHLVSRRMQEKILKMDKEKGTVYFLGRDTDNKKVLSVFLIHKDDFEKVGGFDEDFCGQHGRQEACNSGQRLRFNWHKV